MKVIVGLGNYPNEYYLTRHNIGFLTIDKIKEEFNFENWVVSKKFVCNLSSGEINGVSCLLIKPNTYMNLSGDSVIKVMKFYKINAEDLIVVHDELDLNFGVIKTTNSRNSAGHNGVKSINSKILEQYRRVRIGIGRPENKNYNISNYVLSKFTDNEQEKLEEVIQNAILTIKILL